MTLIGSYILGGLGLRIYNSKKDDFLGYFVADSLPKFSNGVEKWTPELIKARIKTVFNETEKLHYLVVIDPGNFPHSCVLTAIETLQEYVSQKIKIIPSLMARFCYVSSKIKFPPKWKEEVLIIVTICQNLCDWHVLQLTANGYEYICDYLYKTENFHENYENQINERHPKHKLVLVYTSQDSKLIQTLTTGNEKIVVCEKIQVPNWNIMLTEGGILKGFLLSEIPEILRSKFFIDVIDFASAMYLLLDGERRTPLIKQGDKLPAKGKIKMFEKFESFMILRDYQHVECDKITRDTCCLLQQKFPLSTYKLDVTVKIDKSGRCFIKFKYIIANQYDPNIINNPKMIAKIKEIHYQPPKAVIGYVLFSSSCRFYDPKTNKEVIIKCKDTAGLPISPIFNPFDDYPTLRVKDLISQLPIPSVEAIVFVHDGRFPLEWLKQAREVARRYSSRVFFISEPMALKLNALRLLKTNVKDTKTLALTFLWGSQCQIFYLKKLSETFTLIDEAEYSSTDLTKIKNVLLTRRQTHVIAIITDNLTQEILRTFNYENLIVEFIHIENYGKAYIDGAIAKAQKVADGTTNYCDIIQTCGVLKLKIDGVLSDNLCSPYDQIPKTIKTDVYIKDTKDLKIIQYKTAFSKREFILYSNTDIPASWETIQITIKLFLAGLFEVSVTPIIPTEQFESTGLKRQSGIVRGENNEHSERINHSGFLFSPKRPQLIPSNTFDGRESLLAQLKTLGCTFCIFLKEDDQCGSVEVMRNKKFHKVVNLSGNIWTPSYVSFAERKVKVGETALREYKTKPEFVVFDMLRLLARPSSEVIPRKSWHFTIAQNPRNTKFVVYEVETFEGRRRITPEFALALYLKALARLAEAAIGNPQQPQKRVVLYIPTYYKKIHNTALKEACRIAGLSLAQTMQFSKNQIN